MDSVRTKNRQNLQQLEVGFTKREVLEIMGTRTIQTWTPWWSCLFFIPPIPKAKINNPYTTEIVQRENYVWEVIYYYTDIKQEGNAITDDELTPLVFQNDKLIGWGWRFLGDIEAKYEIRFR